VKREFDYWMINENNIKSCCWSNYRTYIENQRILEAFNSNVLTEKKIPDTDDLVGWEKYRTQTWYILEYPGTSRTALVCYK
jgi:type II restriction/modification system DNA methylase subunit YeeA